MPHKRNTLSEAIEAINNRLVNKTSLYFNAIHINDISNDLDVSTVTFLRTLSVYRLTDGERLTLKDLIELVRTNQQNTLRAYTRVKNPILNMNNITSDELDRIKQEFEIDSKKNIGAYEFIHNCPFSQFYDVIMRDDKKTHVWFGIDKTSFPSHLEKLRLPTVAEIKKYFPDVNYLISRIGAEAYTLLLIDVAPIIQSALYGPPAVAPAFYYPTYSYPPDYQYPYQAYEQSAYGPQYTYACSCPDCVYQQPSHHVYSSYPAQTGNCNHPFWAHREQSPYQTFDNDSHPQAPGREM